MSNGVQIMYYASLFELLGDLLARYAAVAYGDEWDFRELASAICDIGNHAVRIPDVNVGRGWSCRIEVGPVGDGDELELYHAERRLTCGLRAFGVIEVRPTHRETF